MSTLRVSNIEAKADPSSPTVNEKVKITNSNGDVMLQLDGATPGITTVGINTTTAAFTVDGAQNIQFVGVVTAASLSGNLTGNVTGNVSGQLSGIQTSITVQSTGSITVGDKFINSSGVGLGTTTTSGRNAGVGTAVGTLIYNTTSGAIEAYGEDGWVNVKIVNNLTGLTATGGVISDYTQGSNVYRSHVFYQSDTFQVTQTSTDYPNNIDIFAVGGGGGGGAFTGAGGGGGGAFTVTAYPVTVASYPITVGSGGAAPPNNSVTSAKGGDTLFSTTLTALGGGGGEAGGSPGTSPNADGGSGGGGNATGRGDANQPSQNPGVANLTNYGELGGTGVGPGQGGGGGAGGVGGNGSSNVGGAGGIGIQNLFAGPSDETQQVGTPGPNPGGGYFGGGGGGGRNGGGQANGGAGGGGYARGPSVSDTSTDPGFSYGIEGTGGGGGGGDNNGQPLAGSKGGHGGSGLLVLRYLIGTSQTGTAKATGGLISFSGGKTIHQFLGSGTFTITDATLTSVEYLVVAGGGGAGSGGGGAGGFRTGSSLPVSSSPGVYPVTVGSGGVSGPGTIYQQGGRGGASVFSTITSTGGGGGGAINANNNTGTGPGGSGGGAGAWSSGTGTAGAGNTPPTSPPQGYPGGGGGPGSPPYASCGGGGAGGAGSANPSNTVSGNGGPGVQSSITGTATYYAGGGGGGMYGVGTAGTGGQGGGGDGSSGPPGFTTGSDGAANTGGGAGGGSSDISIRKGGSGIVIIAYPT